MRIKVLSLFAVAALVLALAFSAAAPAAPNGPAEKAVTAASSEPNAAKATPREPHPQIRAAIAALRDAKDRLQHAAHDFGGHRVEAIKATDEAIRQLEICLRYDKD